MEEESSWAREERYPKAHGSLLCSKELPVTLRGWSIEEEGGGQCGHARDVHTHDSTSTNGHEENLCSGHVSYRPDSWWKGKTLRCA